MERVGGYTSVDQRGVSFSRATDHNLGTPPDLLILLAVRIRSHIPDKRSAKPLARLLTPMRRISSWSEEIVHTDAKQKFLSLKKIADTDAKKKLLAS